MEQLGRSISQVLRKATRPSGDGRYEVFWFTEAMQYSAVSKINGPYYRVRLSASFSSHGLSSCIVHPQNALFFVLEAQLQSIYDI